MTIQDDVKAVREALGSHKNCGIPNCRSNEEMVRQVCTPERMTRILDRLERYEKALNRIAMLGCSEQAYTKEFTERVNMIAREVLSEQK